MARGRTAKVLATHHRDGHHVRRPDHLIVEEPLEIRLDDVLVATTMRTPGHDFELAAGFCFTDGLLGGAPILTCRYCATGSALDTEFNVVSVDTGGRAPAATARLTTATSSCGLCGSTTIDQLCDRLVRITPAVPWDVELLATIPDLVRSEQVLFEATGAVHAAATFDHDGVVRAVREDIGRHNAVDKVVGCSLLAGALPDAGERSTDRGLYVSGRSSLEIVQKAWAAGFSAIVAVSAPSSLAVATAERANLVLTGFTRDGSLNLYTSTPVGSTPIETIELVETVSAERGAVRAP